MKQNRAVHDFLGGQCKNCKTRISLAEKDLYNGYCPNCIKYGFVGVYK